MFKFRKIVLSVLLIAIVILAMGAALSTDRSSYITIRKHADGDDVTLADLSWSWSQQMLSVKKVSDKWNELVFTFVSDTAAGTTATDVEIWGYVKNASAQLMWIGDIEAGTAVGDDGYFIADTIVTTTDETPAGVTLLDEAGNDRHATLRFDGRECEYYLVLLPTVSAGDWFVYVTGD